MQRVISSAAYTSSLPTIFNNHQSNYLAKSNIVEVVDYYSNNNTNKKYKMTTNQNNNNNEIFINYKKVYFNKNKLANFNNKLNLDTNTKKPSNKLEPLKKKDASLLNKKQKITTSTDYIRGTDSDLIMDIIDKKKATLDPIQHAKLAFYDSLLNKNFNKNNTTMKSYKTFDLLTCNNFESSADSSLNEFVESSNDLSRFKLDQKRRIEINHFSKFDNLAQQRKNTQLNPISINKPTAHNMDHLQNKLAIIPETPETKILVTDDSKFSDDLELIKTNKKSNLNRKKQTSLRTKNKNLNEPFNNLIVNNSYTSLPKISKNLNNHDDQPKPKTNKLETSITFPNFSSKKLLDKFNLNLKIEEAFKYTKLLNDRSHQSSLDKIKLKFPNFNSNYQNITANSNDQTSESKKSNHNI